MSADAEAACAAGYGERSDEQVTSRNGYRHREWGTPGPGRLTSRSRSCGGLLLPRIAAERGLPAEAALVSVVATSYLLGVSARRVEKLIQQLGMTSLSK